MEITQKHWTTRQGRDFTRTLTMYSDKAAGTLYPLAGLSFSAEVRKDQDSTSTLYATFTVSVNLSTSVVTLSLTDTQTQGIPRGTAYWDLLVDDSGDNQTWLEGRVSSTGGATAV